MIGKPFKKGQSGNPGGRPKDSELRDLCRAETKANIKALIEIRNNKRAAPAARVAAVNAMFDRGWGKPTQAITGASGGPIYFKNMTDEQLAEFLERGEASLRNIAGEG